MKIWRNLNNENGLKHLLIMILLDLFIKKIKLILILKVKMNIKNIFKKQEILKKEIKIYSLKWIKNYNINKI